MGFIGTHFQFLLLQYLGHFWFILVMISPYIVPSISISIGELIFLNIIIFTRSFIIGVRYGLMSDIRYKLTHSKAKLDWITKDFLITGWFKISPQSFKTECEAAISRLQINLKDFSFTFIRELPKDLADRFSNSDYYEVNIFDQKELNQKIKTQKFLFKTKKHTSSLIDEEIGIIHSSSKDISK